jgi:hypothetical protein
MISSAHPYPCHNSCVLVRLPNCAAAADQLLLGMSFSSLGHRLAVPPCYGQCPCVCRTCRTPVWAAVLRPVFLVPAAGRCGGRQGGGREEGVPYESCSQGGHYTSLCCCSSTQLSIAYVACWTIAVCPPRTSNLSPCLALMPFACIRWRSVQCCCRALAV